MKGPPPKVSTATGVIEEVKNNTEFPPCSIELFKSTTHPRGASNGIEYDIWYKYGHAFINNDMKQVNRFTCCRGYIVDVLFSGIRGESCHTVYYEKDFTKFDLDVFRTGLALRGIIDNGELDKEMPLILDFLNKIEAAFGLQNTKASRNTSYSKYTVYMLEADKFWLASPILVSLYLLFVRAAMPYHKMENTWQETIASRLASADKNNERDSLPLKHAMPYLERFAKYGVKLFFKEDIAFNFPENLSIGRSDGTHQFGINCLVNPSEHNIADGLLEKISHVIDYANRFKDDAAIEEFLKPKVEEVAEIPPKRKRGRPRKKAHAVEVS